MNNLMQSVQRAPSKVNVIFWEVLQVYCELEYHRLVAFKKRALSTVTNNPKFRPFANSFGSGDFTHIACEFRKEDFGRMLNRKGYTSLNVFMMTNWDMTIAHVLSGADGGSNDSTVFENKVRQRLSQMLPPGGYILLDAIFKNTSTTLVPYRGVRYHLKEWARRPDMRPLNCKELFNLRHAMLRNIIERLFGVIRMKFGILRTALQTNLQNTDYISKYNRIVYAIACLFNDMREFGEINIADIQGGIDDGVDAYGPEEDDNLELLGDILRNKIAQELWSDYQNVCAERSSTVEGELNRMHALIADLLKSL